MRGLAAALHVDGERADDLQRPLGDPVGRRTRHDAPVAHRGGAATPRGRDDLDRGPADDLPVRQLAALAGDVVLAAVDAHAQGRALDAELRAQLRLHHARGRLR